MIKRSFIGLLAVSLLCTACAGLSSQQLTATGEALAETKQAAIAADPSLKPAIDTACAATVATTDLAASLKPSSQDARDSNMLAHSGCDTPEARAQLAANDQSAVQPDGGSVKWLEALAVAAKIAVTVAPLISDHQSTDWLRPPLIEAAAKAPL